MGWGTPLADSFRHWVFQLLTYVPSDPILLVLREKHGLMAMIVFFMPMFLLLLVTIPPEKLLN